MVIAFDYYKTISTHERYFKQLAVLYASIGTPVYIISALKNPVDLMKKKEVMKCKVVNNGVHIVPFTNYEDIPELKLQVCKRLGVTHMYDDMPEVCRVLSKENIVTFQVR